MYTINKHTITINSSVTEYRRIFEKQTGTNYVRHVAKCSGY